MATCIIKVKELLSPYMETQRGYRCIVAHPNLAGQAFGRAIPSFEKPYYITHFGDYEDYPNFVKRWPIVAEELRRMGFDKWSFTGGE